MAKYRYSALDAENKQVKGVEKAATPAAARAALAERGLRPLDVAVKSSIMRYEITKKKVPLQVVMNFSRQLSVFIRAGIPILEALEVIAKETTDKQLKVILAEMTEQLQFGQSFASAASSHPEAFPSYYVGVLQSAELTGTLDTVLDQLADYMERDLDSRNQLTSALIYPAVVMGLAIVVIIILAGFVLPRFKTFFEQLHAKLPLPTRILLSIAGFVTVWWWLLLLIVIMLVVGVTVGRRTEEGKKLLDAFVLRLPVVGDLVRASVVERVCRVLAAMIGAGVALPEAMTVAANAANNAVYRTALVEVRSQMMEGSGLAGPIASTGLFPGAAQQMFLIGEQTGTLEEQLKTASTFYQRELDIKTKRFTGLFEPAVLIFVGVVVGFVAVALVSAMYGIYNQVKV
jgi:type IV pilus assembly protein PilC